MFTNTTNNEGTTVLQNEEEAQRFLLNFLEEKYGEQFVCLGSAKALKQPLQTPTYTYSAKYAPASNQSKTFRASVSTTADDAMDNYGQWVFRADVEKIFADFCSNHPYIVRYDMEVLAILTTTKVWTTEDSLEDYFGTRSNRDSAVNLEVWLSDGLSDDKYASQILAMTSGLSELPCAITFRVWANDEYIYERSIYANNTPSDPEEEVYRNIERSRSAYALLN